MRLFSLVLILVLFIGQPAVYAQVNTECRAIDSPFLTYEDASQMDAGMLSIGQSASFAHAAAGDSLSAPGIDFGSCLNGRLELSGLGAVGGWQGNGEGSRVRAEDSYLGMKLLLVNVAHSYPAVAVRPGLEPLGSGNGVGRPHAVLPLILRKDVKLCNLALTGGYVTRGIAFSSLKCEWSIGSRVTPLAVIYGSRMTTNLADLRALGVNRTQLGGSGGLNVDVSPQWSIFLEAGRGFGRIGQNSPRFEFTVGIAFT